MNPLSIFLCAISVLHLGVVIHATDPKFPPQLPPDQMLVEGIKQFHVDFGKALNATASSSTGALEKLFSTEALLFAAGPLPVQGAANASEFFRLTLSLGVATINYKDDVLGSSSKDALAYSVGRYVAYDKAGTEIDNGDYLNVYEKVVSGKKAYWKLAIHSASSRLSPNSTYVPSSPKASAMYAKFTPPRPRLLVWPSNPARSPFDKVPFDADLQEIIDMRERAFQLNFNASLPKGHYSGLGAETNLYQPSFSPFHPSYIKAPGAPPATGLFEIRALHTSFKQMFKNDEVGLFQREQGCVYLHKGSSTPGDYPVALELFQDLLAVTPDGKATFYPIWAGGPILMTKLEDTFYDWRELAFPVPLAL